MDEQQIYTITDDPQALRSLLQACIAALQGPQGRASSREKALAVTKLQEARFWLGEAVIQEL